MTFDNDTARLLFHQLPTENQVKWKDAERILAKQGKLLHVLSVMSDEEMLNVIVRVEEQLHCEAEG